MADLSGRDLAWLERRRGESALDTSMRAMLSANLMSAGTRSCYQWPCSSACQECARHAGSGLIGSSG